MQENKPEGSSKKNRWPLLYGLLLTAFSVFTLLDAFVLPRDVVAVPAASSAETVSSDEEAAADSGSAGGSQEGLRQSGEKKEKSGNGGGNSQGGSENSPGGSGKGPGGSGKGPGAGQRPDRDRQGQGGGGGKRADSGSDGSSSSITKREPVTGETVIASCEEDGISITITQMERYDTQVYAAEVILEDASSLKAGLADGVFGRNISDTTSAIAEENNAILAVNGDYYGFRDRGYVMRNGYLYRDTASKSSDQEDLVIYADGSFEIICESEVTAAELEAKGAVQIFSFGPGLIVDGEISVTAESEVTQSMQSNPRTAIGEIEPLHYIFLVSDGRSEESEGLTLLELAGVMQEFGCTQAYNLDGGGSSTMWFEGEIINNPTNGMRDGERSISDIVFIG